MTVQCIVTSRKTIVMHVRETGPGSKGSIILGTAWPATPAPKGSAILGDAALGHGAQAVGLMGTQDWVPLDWAVERIGHNGTARNLVCQRLMRMMATGAGPALKDAVRKAWVEACLNPPLTSATPSWDGVCMPLKGWEAYRLLDCVSHRRDPNAWVLEAGIKEVFSCSPRGTVHRAVAFHRDSVSHLEMSRSAYLARPDCNGHILNQLLASDPSMVTCVECKAMMVEEMLA